VDPFGHASLRRLERALIGEHRNLVREAIAHLTPETAAQVAEIAALADLVRGYEHIKRANIERYREAARVLLPELARV
jgi:indolepyruvate ferredoxin oxidoreductase